MQVVAVSSERQATDTMSFISFSFLFLFLFTFLVRLTVGRQKTEKAYLLLLLIISLIFYGSYIPWYLTLLLFTTLVDYYAGQHIYENPSSRSKKLFLVLSLTANLGLLAFFKYTNFFMDTTILVARLFGAPFRPLPHLDLILPIGISFFTFQSMSYTIDIYRGLIKPERTYWRFLLFVCFFTHLISGPIVRARELIYQFDRKRRIHLKVLLEGLYLIISGLFFKMVVADNIGDYINTYWKFGSADNMAAVVPFLLTLLFSCQIFSDFLGYSRIAMGTAYLLGFKLPLNFNNPYIASSFREFWTRWHITLSTWIRDYLYIPLGGNKGSELKTYATLMITMILAGLWHGAALTFVFWGAIHGLALLFERILRKNGLLNTRSILGQIFGFFVVQATILVSWVFFRSDTLAQAFRFLNNLFFNGGWNPSYGSLFLSALWFVLPVFFLHLRGLFIEKKWLSVPGPIEKGILAALMLYGIFTLYGKTNAFLYFKF